MTLHSLQAYGKAFQLKVLGSLLTDKGFVLNVRDMLGEDLFDADAHKWIIKQILRYFDEYHTSISMNVLKVELQKIENEVLKVAIKEELRNSYDASQEDLDYVQKEFTDFCRNQEMKAAILASADKLKEGDFDGIRSSIEKALRAGQDKSLGHEYKKDVETRYREDYRPTIPSPWPILNDAIAGGFGPGDLILFFGSPGGGKCVDYNTEIEIEYPEYGLELQNNVGKNYTLWFKPWDEFNISGEHLYGWQAYNLLKSYMNIQVKTCSKKTKIGDLFFDLGIEPRSNNVHEVEFDIKVKTPYGLKPIRTLFTTERQKTVTTYFRNGKRLTTSAHHLLRTLDGDWKKVQDCKIGDKIETEFGSTDIIKQNYKSKEKVLYDMSVDEVHCYYSNGIVSHNSWLAVSIAAWAAKMGYNVNYYTLELSEDYVGKRFDASLSGHNIDFLKDQRALVEELSRNLKGNIIIKEYAPKGAGISTVEAHIQRCIDMGMKPDLVVIDYLDYLRPPLKSRYAERKDEIDDVYVSAKGLAKKFKIPVISPSQVNRAGAKDDVVEGDKAAGSYDKLMVSDISLSLSRKREDKVLGTGRLHIMKNRYGADGITYNIKLDTNTGKMEIEGFHEEDAPTIGSSANGSLSVNRELLSKFFGK